MEIFYLEKVGENNNDIRSISFVQFVVNIIIIGEGNDEQFN